MGYNKINWQNNATTPLNAANLNKMDDAISILFTAGTRVQQVLVDVVNGNDSTGEYNDASKPFKTLDHVLNDLYASTYTEIFIKGNAVASSTPRLVNASVVMLAYGVGTPDVNADTSSVTFGAGFRMQLSGGTSFTSLIDTTYSTGTVASGSITVGDGSGMHLYDHRVHDFTNSPSNSGYAANSRESEITVTTADVPIIFMYGAGASFSVNKADVVDTAVGGTPALFTIGQGTSIASRLSAYKINGVESAQALASRLSGILKNSGGYPYNIISSVDFSTLTVSSKVAAHSDDVDF